MAKYSMNINEYVAKDKTYIETEEEFFDHIDTIKLAHFEGKVNIPTTECKRGNTTKVDHISSVFVTLEVFDKGMLRRMRWLEAKNKGCGYEVLKNGYVITVEYENEEDSIGCNKNFIYEPDDADSAFEMFSKICAMYKF